VAQITHRLATDLRGFPRWQRVTLNGFEPGHNRRPHPDKTTAARENDYDSDRQQPLYHLIFKGETR
jgi:hypothetical protein